MNNGYMNFLPMMDRSSRMLSKVKIVSKLNQNHSLMAIEVTIMQRISLACQNLNQRTLIPLSVEINAYRKCYASLYSIK